MRRLAFVVATALLLVGCGTTSPSPTPTAETIGTLPLEVSLARAEELRQAGALVLDVREPSEWAAGVIPGATLISLGELDGRKGELPRDQTIVVVCRSGNRSAQGRDILLAAGFRSVTSLVGGMTDWASAGLPVTTPS
ncbi:MAG: rhodanese-like domain-containing protein [Chloroflexi bacterium]|nr:rhodanese-like domain-containing protein [Chloroflexota bacterium]